MCGHEGTAQRPHRHEMMVWRSAHAVATLTSGMTSNSAIVRSGFLRRPWPSRWYPPQESLQRQPYTALCMVLSHDCSLALPMQCICKAHEPLAPSLPRSADMPPDACLQAGQHAHEWQLW
jgi:hypothetical protein